MKQEEIVQMFENRWRIKGHVFSTEDHVQTEIKELCRDFFETGILLGESDRSGLPMKVINAGHLNTMRARARRFFTSFYTSDNVRKYGKQMLQDFYDYWTEPNPSNTKMRFELQKTWDVNRRLARWARNNFNRYDRQPTKPDAAERLTDILIG